MVLLPLNPLFVGGQGNCDIFTFKLYQGALFEQGIAAASFAVEDNQTEYKRTIEAHQVVEKLQELEVQSGLAE